MTKKRRKPTSGVCGDCRNFKKGRCKRKDEPRKAGDQACGHFDPR